MSREFGWGPGCEVHLDGPSGFCDQTAMPRVPVRPIWVVAAVLFGAHWYFLSQTLPVWSEGVAVYPSAAGEIVATPPDGSRAITFQPSCGEDAPVRIVHAGVRPRVALCREGWQYPLQITSYASGIPFWVADLFRPLHEGRVFRLRAAGLLLGLLNLFLLARLLHRFADAVTADVAVLVSAVMPAFNVVHGLLVHYDEILWTGTAAALVLYGDSLDAADRSGRASVGTWRLVLVAVLLGVAFISNIKVLFLWGPIAIFAIRSGFRFRKLRRREVAIASAAFLLVCLPSVFANSLDRGEAFGGRVVDRVAYLVSQLDPSLLLAEIPNSASFLGDTLVILTYASGDPAPVSRPAFAVALVAIVYCLVSAVRWLLFRRGPLVPAICGAWLFTLMLVSAYLYVGVPKGNYLNLFVVIGAAVASMLVEASRWIASRTARGVGAWLWPAATLAAVCFSWAIVGRGRPDAFLAVSFNARAVRELAAHLETSTSGPGRILVATENLGGVLEAVTGGNVRTVRINEYLSAPPLGREEEASDDPVEVAHRRVVLLDRFSSLLDRFPETVRFVMPLIATPTDEPFASDYMRSALAAAKASGRAAELETSFAGVGTPPLLGLLRVDPQAGLSALETPVRP